MSRPWPTPTRADHARFVDTEGWTPVPSSHHGTHELALPDGTVLRTRISRPPDRTTYGARMWAHILRDPLAVTEEAFGACVRGGLTPDRGTDGAPEDLGDRIPLDVVRLLLERVGLTRQRIRGMTREQAIARLNEHWSTGR
ncbi:MAG: cytotoxic translational repressor of toxin-antitoxin stability system [Nitriliruptoraceae bacterium]